MSKQVEKSILGLLVAGMMLITLGAGVVVAHDHESADLKAYYTPFAVEQTEPNYKWTKTLSIPRNVNVEIRLSGEVKPGDFDQLGSFIHSLKAAFEKKSKDS